MSDRKNIFEKIAANQPKRTFTGPVMDERGNKDLPPSKKGGEKMKPDLHEIHKQHTFDSLGESAETRSRGRPQGDKSQGAYGDIHERPSGRSDGATCGVRRLPLGLYAFSGR